ncbi:MAG: hypothetical protein IPM14_02690 [bacterium]|nr:hypothetical protein [bacterium]
MTAPTVEDVARIVSIGDPVVRNLNITQGYYELSQAMSKYTDGNPNWCTFAVWASKQAGQSIRKEDLSRTFENLFHNSPEITLLLNTISQHSDVIKNLPEVKAVSSFIIKFINPDSAFEHSAWAVAEGNKKYLQRSAESSHVFFLSLKAKKISLMKIFQSSAQLSNLAIRRTDNKC